MHRKATEAGRCEPSVTTKFGSDGATSAHQLKATMQTGKYFKAGTNDIYPGLFVISPDLAS